MCSAEVVEENEANILPEYQFFSLLLFMSFMVLDFKIIKQMAANVIELLCSV